MKLFNVLAKTRMKAVPTRAAVKPSDTVNWVMKLWVASRVLEVLFDLSIRRDFGSSVPIWL